MPEREARSRVPASHSLFDASEQRDPAQHFSGNQRAADFAEFHAPAADNGDQGDGGDRRNFPAAANHGGSRPANRFGDRGIRPDDADLQTRV